MHRVHSNGARIREHRRLPNAIYFSGDTICFEELVQIRDKFHIVVAVLAVKVPLPDGHLQIIMDGKQGARLFREIKADILVPMHYESWGHFTQNGKSWPRSLRRRVSKTRFSGSRQACRRRSFDFRKVLVKFSI